MCLRECVYVCACVRACLCLCVCVDICRCMCVYARVCDVHVRHTCTLCVVVQFVYMYTVHCTMYSVPCTYTQIVQPHTVYIVHSVQCTPSTYVCEFTIPCQWMFLFTLYITYDVRRTSYVYINFVYL